MPRLISNAIFSFLSVMIYCQPVDCTQWKGAEISDSGKTIILSGVINQVHPYRMFLCVRNDRIHGIYEMRSTARTIDLEGFVKGDSIFLGEYSRTQNLLGTIKGLFAHGRWEGTMYHPDAKYAGDIMGAEAITWIQAGLLSKNIADSLSESSGKIVLYQPESNHRKTQLLLTYPNDYSCRAILNHSSEKMPFFFSGKKPGREETKYFSNKHNNKHEKNTVLLSARSVQLTLTDQVVSPDTLLLEPNMVIPLRVKALSDRLVSYEIHYPQTDDPNAREIINSMVNQIKHKFDSIRTVIRRQYSYDEYHPPTRMVAWFEPSLCSKQWLCGHFIIDCSEQQISETMPLNYSFLWNKNIDLNTLLRHNSDQPLDWNALINSDNKTTTSGADAYSWSDPVLSYGNILLTTPFNRVYDRKLHQLPLNQDNLNWKWWLPTFWWIKIKKR